MAGTRHIRPLGPSKFGALLRDFRVAAGLTQEELAEGAGVSARGLSDLERGISRNPQKATLARLAAALQLTAEERAEFEAAVRAERADPAGRDDGLLEQYQPYSLPAPADRHTVGSGTATSWWILRRRVLASVALLLVLGMGGLVYHQRSSAVPGPAGSFMIWGSQPVSGAMRAPSAVAVDPAGNLLVSDSGNDRIEKLDSTGVQLSVWGGIGAGRLRAPRGLTIDGRGHIFVVDAGNSRILELSPTGRLLQTWPWKFPQSRPTMLQIDRQNRVYLLDVGHYCIYLLMGSDNLPYWCPASESEYASGFAFDAHGALYVTTVTGMVIKPSTLGEAAHPSPVLWRVPGSAHRTDILLEGIVVDHHGSIVVADGTHDRIWKLSPAGKQIAVWGGSGAQPGQYRSPHGLALDDHGNIVVADTGNNRIVRLTPAGAPLDAISRARNLFQRARSITVDSRGNIYVLAGEPATRLVKFSPGGRLLSDWGPASFGIAAGSTYFLSGVAVDSHGDVYVADPLNDRIDKVAPNGSLLAHWTTSHESGAFLTPFGVTVDRHDRVFVADTGRNRVVELSSDGRFLGSMGTAGNNRSSGSGTLTRPQSVAVDLHGNVLVADTGAHRIVVFSTGGQVVRQWDTRQAGAGRVSEPVSIALDRLGTVHVADASNNQIDQYSAQGDLLAVSGTRGSSPGQFRSPGGVAVDAMGNVYVADTGNDRVQRSASR